MRPDGYPCVVRLLTAVSSILLLAGCGPAITASCPPSSTLTYSNFGQGFATSYCVSCHSSALVEKGVDLSSQALVAQHAGVVYQEASAKSSMPPPGSAPAPTAAERAQLGDWLACGAP